MKRFGNFMSVSFGILLFLFLATFLEVLIVEGKITEIRSWADFSIIEYMEVSHDYNGQILTRTIRLKVENKGEEYLYNVKAMLQSAPDGVTIDEPEVYFGDIAPGEILDSQDDFTLLIDTSKVLNEIIFVWKIEYEDRDKNQFFNETILAETMQ